MSEEKKIEKASISDEALAALSPKDLQKLPEYTAAKAAQAKNLAALKAKGCSADEYAKACVAPVEPFASLQARYAALQSNKAA